MADAPITQQLAHRALDLGWDATATTMRWAGGKGLAAAKAARGRATRTRRRWVADRVGAAREAGWSWWSTNSRLSLGSISSHQSVLSVWSLWSFGSAASLGSAGSVGSIGSVGSLFSIGSAGSILSIGAAGSVLSIGGVKQRPIFLRDLPPDASVDDVKLALVDRGATMLGALALAASLR